MLKADRLSPRQAAQELGISLKAIQQAIARGAFPNREKESGSANARIWLPRADVEAYAARRGIALGDATPPTPASKRRPPSERRDSAPRPSRSSEPRARERRPSSDAQQTLWQREAEELLQENFTLRRENLELRVRVRELEARERR
jgi:hypothetical protein